MHKESTARSAANPTTSNFKLQTSPCIPPPFRLQCAAVPFDPATEQRLLNLFAVPALRAGQRELLQAVLDGHNALGVLPTGHGKSLVYQAAAFLSGGVSVVVSPLIALMRDQCESLARIGIPAARFDSTLEPDERNRVLCAAAEGSLRLLYVAPESLENPALFAVLRQAPLNLFVVDEAHCVSAWGHSFRPDYLRLPAWRARLPFRCTLALTATANPQVRADLLRTFGIEAEHAVILSPYRPNIRRLCIAAEDRQAELRRFLAEPAHNALPAIVYCRTRKETERLAAELKTAGYAAACYHAGQPAELRAQLQDAFLDNTLTVLVATIAFGMGVDKPDVRAVIHYSLPGSPEAYLQESGRAGRDGKPCTALVLLNGADMADARNRLRAEEPDAEGVLRCVRWLLPAVRRAVSPWEVSTTCDVAEDVYARALQRLEEAGAVETEARGYKFYKVKPLFPLRTVLDGRSAEECARLQWLDAHREGEVEAAAEAWNCSYAAAMEQLQECESAGEWKLSFRQRALCIHTLQGAEAREHAAALSRAYASRRAADEARLERLADMLCSPVCLNAALERYFMGEDAALPPCGHCSACLHASPTLPTYTPPPFTPPPAEDLPEFDRPAQRRRFLLGLSSPGLLARRAWAHPHYGCAAGQVWENV